MSQRLFDPKIINLNPNPSVTRHIDKAFRAMQKGDVVTALEVLKQAQIKNPEQELEAIASFIEFQQNFKAPHWL